MLHQLVYVSSTQGLLSRDALRELLVHSREKNARLGITGMLLYRDGNVMQVLEGESSAVQSLYASIAADPRHSGLIVLTQGPVPAREFAEWQMGFRDLRSEDVRTMPGYSEFLNMPLDGEVTGARGMKLLRLFKSRM